MSISSLYTNTSSVTNVPILSKAIANSVVWIAATFSMQDKDEEKQITEQTKEQSATANQIAAFSVYHGLDDTRNIAEKVTLKKDQDLNDVYIMGVEHILEQFKNDPGDLVIHTGCAFLQNCLEEQDNKSTSSTGDNEKHLDNIRTKIAKRNGDTSFTTSSLEEDEFKAALKMAKEKLTEKEE
ncbi:hypothetical protein BDF20DRAFT_881546 [Mycotypha africana]|uniref:uncharacterized protein n=1 Tax=Mycotypha africana TaxID=64632 RepID=UPI0022FFC9B6|nr:uncharacterized protein BDF20DRAFT_881546 [Mycotypha africana]KAI8973285.1 hypothetical protein BDF20DRAFT_881546 [Mycotypha africana]